MTDPQNQSPPFPFIKPPLSPVPQQADEITELREDIYEKVGRYIRLLADKEVRAHEEKLGMIIEGELKDGHVVGDHFFEAVRKHYSNHPINMGSMGNAGGRSDIASLIVNYTLYRLPLYQNDKAAETVVEDIKKIQAKTGKHRGLEIARGICSMVDREIEQMFGKGR